MADIQNIPQEIKDAAKALILISLPELANNKEEERRCTHIWLGTFNEALYYLLKTGLSDTLKLLDEELTAEREAYLAFEQIMCFFWDNPAAEVATPPDFSEGSLAREVLEAFVCEIASDENPPQGLASNVAAIERANCRRKLERLLLAREAIQRAITSERG
jgi:hypothetical protein